MLKIFYSKDYEKSLKKLVKAGKIEILEIDEVINKIASQEKLPIKNRDHKLKGDFDGYRECHIRPDILLIYKIIDDSLLLYIVDIGSHSQLFGM